jgi:hypothetical protein
MADYTRGTSSQIIVGAAALFVYKGSTVLTDEALPTAEAATSYKETLSKTANATNWRNVGYTNNGLEVSFEPDFGEVKVDQLLDVAKMYKQGMQVNLKTSLAEATLENLLLAIARPATDRYTGTTSTVTIGIYSKAFGAGADILNISAGELGESPYEKGLVAVGASTTGNERIYAAYRALSMDSVTVSAKREEATMFDVSFRLLPNNGGSYGKIVDRATA